MSESTCFPQVIKTMTRYSIERGLFGWIVHTELDWFHFTTKEEACAFAKEEVARIELENETIRQELETKRRNHETEETDEGSRNEVRGSHEHKIDPNAGPVRRDEDDHDATGRAE